MSVITKASLKSNANAANKILNKTPTLKGLLERTANTNGRYISAPSLSANRYQQSTGKADDEKVKRLNTKEIGKPPKESIIGASYQERFSATAGESKIEAGRFALTHTRTVTRVEQSGSTGTSMGVYAYTDYNLSKKKTSWGAGFTIPPGVSGQVYGTSQFGLGASVSVKMVIRAFL